MGRRLRNQLGGSKDSKDIQDIRDPVTWSECLHAIRLLRKVDPGKYVATVATVSRSVDASVSSPVTISATYSIGLEQQDEDTTIGTRDTTIGTRDTTFETRDTTFESRDTTFETRDVVVTITNMSGTPLFFPLIVRLNGVTSHMIFLFPEESKQEPNIECPATPTIVAPLVPLA